jgi:acyl-CoA synthetase (AMP-forming)/AMP-acid ligase II
MPKLPFDGPSLWELTARPGLSRARHVADADGRVCLSDLIEASTIVAPMEALRGRCVLLSSRRQLPAVLAMLQLDGLAKRILLTPPDLAAEHLPAIAAEAGVDLVVTDGTGPAADGSLRIASITCGTVPTDAPYMRDLSHREASEWLLFTSGTTGRPKLVQHNLASLTGPLSDGPVVAADALWSTFYDVRRYGGLQILLRALLGGGSMLLSQADEPVGEFIARAGAAGVTHISGTPSHWRRALMSPASGAMRPRYVRLSGEVADQVILNNLAAAYPDAQVAHAFASTEAGVAFDVRDGLAGFPASLIGQTGGQADLRVVDGSLRIRSPRVASRYLGEAVLPVDAEGFVDTNDMLELRGDRYHFVGRREGVINVGGQKVHPEEVEAVISQHPLVQMARVRGRPNPIVGTLVVADVVMRPDGQHAFATLKQEILDACRRVLPAYKVPAMLHHVASLDIAGSGKLVRRLA